MIVLLAFVATMDAKLKELDFLHFEGLLLRLEDAIYEGNMASSYRNAFPCVK